MPRHGWFLILLLTGAAHAGDAADDAHGRREALVEVSINGERQKDWVLVELEETGAPWVRRSDLSNWGIQVASDSPLASLAPSALLPLRLVPGVSAVLNGGQSELDVNVQPALLRTQRFRAEASPGTPTPSPLAAFLNYDVAGYVVQGPPTLRATTEFGVVYGDWVARSASLTSVADGTTHSLRLDSNVTADYPSSRTSLQWGDSFARLGTNADPVRIGGVSWGTDFSVTPSFITIPLPTVNNLALSPGNVDLYVNGNKTQQLNVPAGPFSIAQVPVTTGAGELTIVTRDLSGRVQTYTQSYYIAPQMLKAGLSAWDFQLGSKREEYAIESDVYRGWLASGGQRIGLSDRLTGQWRVEADETGAAISGQLLSLSGGASLWTVSPSCSRVHAQSGCLLDLSFEHDRPMSGYGIDLSGTSTSYLPVAAFERAQPARFQVLAHAQAAKNNGLSGLASVSWRELADGGHSVNLNLSAGKTFARAGHIDLLWSQDLSSSRSSFLTLLYTRSLGSNRSVSASLYTLADHVGASASVEQSLPLGEGYGYQLRAAHDTLSSVQAIGEWNGNHLAMSGDFQHEGTQSVASLDVSGAVVFIGEHLLTTRRLDQSFAVLRAQDLNDLPVYLNGQKVASTDTDGWVVLPNVRAFVPNKVALDSTSVPLDLSVPETHYQVIPYRRGASFIDVPVYFGATVRLIGPDGQPVPANARLVRGAKPSPVGTQGLTYVEGKRGVNRLTVEWPGGSCRATLDLPLPPNAVLGVEGELALPCQP